MPPLSMPGKLEKCCQCLTNGESPPQFELIATHRGHVEAITISFILLQDADFIHQNSPEKLCKKGIRRESQKKIWISYVFLIIINIFWTHPAAKPRKLKYAWFSQRDVICAENYVKAIHRCNPVVCLLYCNGQTKGHHYWECDIMRRGLQVFPQKTSTVHRFPPAALEEPKKVDIFENRSFLMILASVTSRK